MTDIKNIGWSKETGLVIQFEDYKLHPSCFECSKINYTCPECGYNEEPCLDCKDKTEVLIKPTPVGYNISEKQYNNLIKIRDI